MKSTLVYRDGHLCILDEIEEHRNGHSSTLEIKREWHAVQEASEAEVATLLGRPVNRVETEEGLYVDEEGMLYQVADKEKTKPVAVERLAGVEKSELETLLQASLKGGKQTEPGNGKRAHRRIRTNGHKPQATLQVVSPTETVSLETPRVATNDGAATDDAHKEPPQLNVRQKLAEVRRRIGYVQKWAWW